MSWTIQIRAVHAQRDKVIERVVDACPALLGRDRAMAACALEGDDSVSKVHASIDVRGERLFVRDVRSTNGTFTGVGRLPADRWTDVGAAEAENEIRIGGWHLYLRGRRPPSASRSASGARSSTVFEPLPFGASQATTAVGTAEASGLLTSFPSVVDRMSDPVQAFRIARAALENAVAAAIVDTSDKDRADLARTLEMHYAELRETSALVRYVEPRQGNNATGVGGLALQSMRDLSRAYVASDCDITTVADIRAFQESLRSGIDALVHGLVQALAGINTYADEMNVSAGASAELPGTASALARAAFDWRPSATDGGALVRRAFHELAVHQLASYNAILSGIRELLRELAPETIEAALAREQLREGFWKRLWHRLLPGRRLLRVYRQRHRDLSTEESARLALIFGPKFAEEYHAVARETRTSALAQGFVNRRDELPVAVPLVPAGRGTVPLAPVLTSQGGGTVPLGPVLDAPRTRSQMPTTGTVPMAPALRADDSSEGDT